MLAFVSENAASCSMIREIQIRSSEQASLRTIDILLKLLLNCFSVICVQSVRKLVIVQD